MSEWIDGQPPRENGLYAVQFPKGVRTIEYCGTFRVGDRAEGEYVVDAIRYCRLPDLPKPLPLPRRFRAKHVGIPVSGVQFSKTPCLFLWESATGWGWGNTEGEFKEIEWIDHEPTQESQP